MQPATANPLKERRERTVSKINGSQGRDSIPESVEELQALQDERRVHHALTFAEQLDVAAKVPDDGEAFAGVIEGLFRTLAKDAGL